MICSVSWKEGLSHDSVYFLGFVFLLEKLSFIGFSELETCPHAP